MAIYYILGSIIFLLALIFDRKILRVELDKLAKFLAFMAIVIVFKLAILSFTNGHQVNPFAWMPTWRLGMVWWEDMVYALPIFYLMKIDKTKHKLIAKAVAIVLSIHFGLGHIYQGLSAVFITALYPYFISYRYGKNVGFGTVMVAHIIYDFVITALMRFGHYMA